MYCQHCGKEIADVADVCVHCGVSTHKHAGARTRSIGKSRMAAGLMAIFLGALGIHNFYLGYHRTAVTQLLLGTVGTLAFGLGPAISAIWGIVDAVRIFTGEIARDADGHLLSE